MQMNLVFITEDGFNVTLLLKCLSFKSDCVLSRVCGISVRGARRPQQPLFLLRNHLFHLGREVQPQRPLHDDPRLSVHQDLGPEHGEPASGDVSGGAAGARRKVF